jgi:hypothetical protein
MDMDHIPVMLSNSAYAILGVMGPANEYPRLREALLRHLSQTSTYATLRRVIDNYSIKKNTIAVRTKNYESRSRGATQHPSNQQNRIAPVDTAAVTNTGKSDESPTCFQTSTSVYNEGDLPSQSTSELVDNKADETSVSAETNEETAFAIATLDINVELQASCQLVDVRESLQSLNETTGNALDTTDNNSSKPQFIPPRMIGDVCKEAWNDPQRDSPSILSVGAINGEYDECSTSLVSPAAENLEAPLPTAELSTVFIPNVPELGRKIIPLTALSSRRRPSINKTYNVNSISRIPRPTKRRAETTLRTDATKKARVDMEISTSGEGNSGLNPVCRKDGLGRLDRMGASKRKLGYVNSKVITLSMISILIVAIEIAS